MFKDPAYHRPVFHRREVLSITGIERGLFQGWEERKLVSLGGELYGTGKKREFSFAEVIAIAIARDMCLAGVKASLAWSAVTQSIDLILAEAVQYLIVSVSDDGGATIETCSDESDLVRILKPFTSPGQDPDELPPVYTLVRAEAIRTATMKAIKQHFSGVKDLSDDELLRRKAALDEEN